MTVVDPDPRATAPGDPNMRRPLLAGTALVLTALMARADDTDPIKADLDKAKARYEKAIERHRQEVGKWFDEEVKKARGLKDNKKAVDRLTDERAAFDSTGLLPAAKSAKQLREKGDAVRADLDRAYQKAIKDYTSPAVKDDKAAAAVEKEFVKYLGATTGPRLIGRWKYVNNYIDDYSPNLTFVQFTVSGLVNSTGNWQVEKDGMVKLVLKNGWNAEGRLVEHDRCSWVYRGPRGEVDKNESRRLPK